MTKGSFYRGGPILASAVSGLDQALWDIAGKHYGAPVHQLLGGPVRDRIRVYGWVGGDEPAEIRDQISAQVEAGLTAVKMNASRADEPARLGRRARRASSSGWPPPARSSATTATSLSTSTADSPSPTSGGSPRCWSRTGRSSSKNRWCRRTRT